jgi:MinD superfamily P-loop ATPase
MGENNYVCQKGKMKELVVISGKGGTGKTSLVGAFASLAHNTVFCDADVDAADLHLLLHPRIEERQDFFSGHTAVIDLERCIRCGICRDLCKWRAISEEFSVDPISCEGCGVCVHFCPEKAIEFAPNKCGEWYISDTRFGLLVHARLGIAQENSGKLVALVRQQARKLAENGGRNLILTDGPPGIGCPVIASIGGATAVLIVTEPTVSGRHDLERVLQLASHFNVPALVCINKADLYLDMTNEIMQFTGGLGATFIGTIPFDRSFTEAMVQGKTIVEYDVSEAGQAVKSLWHKVQEKMDALPST